jgi:hypothetical protein
MSMASRVVTQLISDLSGNEINDGKGETIEFAYRGTAYSIDLTAKEATDFDKSVALYVEHASKTSSSRRGRGARGGTGTDAKAVRAWAKKQGIAVPERGRIPHHVREQYEASH